MRETDGIAMRSSTREDQRLAHHPMDQESMLGRIQIRHAGMAALIVQICGRDRADELVQRRLRIDRGTGIDMARARARLRECG